MMSMSSPLMEITLDGDMMTIKNSSLMRTVEHKFKLGEEYEEHMPNSTIKVSILNKLIHSMSLIIILYLFRIYMCTDNCSYLITFPVIVDLCFQF